jgi:hypothetical protein
MWNYAKKKLGIGKDKEVPATEQFYTPLRIALHSTISLNTVDMLVIKDQLHPLFVLPNGPLEVLAIGNMNFDGTTVYQVYVKDTADEEFVLQMAEGKDYRSQEPTIDEVILFKQVVTFEPETADSLERALNDIGYTDIELDDVEYQRFWGDNFTEKMEFRTYSENVVTPGGNQYFTNNYILYGRPIRVPDVAGYAGISELLLVGLEEDENSAQIMMQVGLQMSTTDIQVQ